MHVSTILPPVLQAWLAPLLAPRKAVMLEFSRFERPAQSQHQLAERSLIVFPRAYHTVHSRCQLSGTVLYMWPTRVHTHTDQSLDNWNVALQYSFTASRSRHWHVFGTAQVGMTYSKANKTSAYRLQEPYSTNFIPVFHSRP